jgi:hypothetical protein
MTGRLQTYFTIMTYSIYILLFPTICLLVHITENVAMRGHDKVFKPNLVQKDNIIFTVFNNLA